MAEKNSYDAGREALREVLNEPERTTERDNALLRYLGIDYWEEQDEARQAMGRLTKEDPR
jgi:hypothetical protein